MHSFGQIDSSAWHSVPNTARP